MKLFLFLQHKPGRIFLLLAAAFFCSLQSQGQGKSAKGPIQLADEYFAAGEYYTAADLYGQFLNPPKSNKLPTNFPLNSRKSGIAGIPKGLSRTDILMKQAESYRLANYFDKADMIYKQLVEKDGNDDALYWHGVSQRALNDFGGAEVSLKKYISANASGKYKDAAQKELRTLSYIRQQLARPDSILTNLSKLNTPNNSNEKGAFAPVHIGGDQFLISSTQTDSVQVNGVNPNHSRLFYATLNNGGFDPMTPVAISGAGPLDNQGASAISADGKYLYFTQWKKVGGRTVSSIYYAIKQGNGWSSPVLLSAVNTEGYNSKQPFCSTDGKYLFFASDRPGGTGRFDIWYATINADGTTGNPVNAGSSINTAGDEVAPFYHRSSTTLVFSSNGKEGMGGFDLFAAKGNETNWKAAGNLGYPVNSSRDDIYFFAKENSPLLSSAIFSSDRGTGCCLETYKISKAAKKTQFGGVLRDCRDKAPVSNAAIVLKDGEGKTWTTTTDENGRYNFDLTGSYYNLTLTINRELYNETTAAVKLDSVNIDESDLLINKLINTEVCIEKKLVIKPEDVVTLYFDFDKSALKPAAINKLDSIYKVLVAVPNATIQISGYTDGRGTVEYNAKLSDRRARACADYLISKGIDASRVSFVSFGACCPVEMELINGRDNADGRSKNRRALINVKKD